MAGRQNAVSSLLSGLTLVSLGLSAVFTAAGPEPASAEAVQVAEVVPVVATPEAPAARNTAPVDKKTAATMRVQRCYAKLGYYKGPIDGKASDATWTAHWYFKNDHGLKAHGNFLSSAVQKKIDALCGDEAELDAAEAAGSEGLGAEGSELAEVTVSTVPDRMPEPPAPAQVSQTPEKTQLSEPSAAAPLPTAEEHAKAQAAQETREELVTARLSTDLGTGIEEETPPPPTDLGINCLPEDLIAFLQNARTESVAARSCRRACLPPPKGLSQKQRDDLYSRYGVVWCRSCVQIGGYLSLGDIALIEDAGELQLCATPPRELPRPGVGNGNRVQSFSRIRELYRALPSASEDDGAIGVIIGNGVYDNLPPAQTAKNDAGAMYLFLTEHLGFRQDRIIDLRNATRADFERVFGPEPGSDGTLKRLVRAQSEAKVVVYYSGHGATDASQSDTYLIPVDAQPYREERGAYPLSTLYANLAELNAQSVLVLLESSFGRDQGAYVLPPNIPETTRSALPQGPLPPLTVLVAADRGQRAMLDTDYDIGLFTRYVIEGLAGSADLHPVGDGNGRVDSAELYVFTTAMVRRAARKTFGLLQEPVYSSAETAVLKAPEEVAAKPN